MDGSVCTVPVIIFAERWLVTILCTPSLFVCGSSTGSAEKFICRICHRDVSMRTRGAEEFSRHFFCEPHWHADVAYRVREGLPNFNRLMDPLELSAEQVSSFLSRPSKGLADGFSFPEDLLPTCTRVDPTIPLLTMVMCLLELFRSGGSYFLFRKLWVVSALLLVPKTLCTISSGVVRNRWLVIF